MSKKLELNVENVLLAYRNASTEQKALLEDMFGKELFKSRDITERVKTFEDACNQLGEDNPLVYLYNVFVNEIANTKHATQDLIAYLKLSIIVAALNDGWEPQFTKDEYRYFPWFYFYTQDEYDTLDEKTKGRCVLRSGHNTNSNYGFVHVSANNDASSSYGVNGTRLAFRTRELAEYAGRQFVEIFAYFVLKSQDLDC